MHNQPHTKWGLEIIFSNKFFLFKFSTFGAKFKNQTFGAKFKNQTFGAKFKFSTFGGKFKNQTFGAQFKKLNVTFKNYFRPGPCTLGRPRAH